MSNYRNSAYDSEPSYLGKAVTVAALGAIGIGSWKAVTGEKGEFEKQFNKVFDWVAPKTMKKYTGGQQVIKNFKDVISGAGKEQRLNVAADQRLRDKKAPVTFDPEAVKSFEDTVQKISENKNTHFARTNFDNEKGLDNIVDFEGRSLEGEIEEIKKIFLEKGHGVSGHEFNGTTLKLNFGTRESLELGFSAFDKESGAFLKRKGTASFVVNPFAEYSEKGIEIVNPNVAITRMLKDKERMKAYAKESPTFKSSLEKDVKGMLHEIKGARVDKAINEASHIQLASWALESLHGSEIKWGTALSTDVFEHRGHEVVPDLYTLGKMNEEFPGFSGGFLPTSSANPVGDNYDQDRGYIGENRRKKLKMDTNPATKKYWTDSSGTEHEYASTDRYSKLSHSLSSKQVAENTLYAGDVHGIPVVEANKSFSGMRFTTGGEIGTGSTTKKMLGALSFNTKEAIFVRKGISLSMTAPVSDSFDIPITASTIPEGSDLLNKTKLSFYNEYGTKDLEKTAFMHELIDRSNAEVEAHIGRGGTFRYDGNTVAGLDRKVTSVTGMIQYAENTASEVKFRGVGFLNEQGIMEMREAARQTGKYQVTSFLQSDAIKLMFENEQIRGSVGYFDPTGKGEGARLDKLLKTINPKIELGTVVGAELFAKTFPVNGMMQKGGHMHLQTMQHMIEGIRGVVNPTTIRSDSYTNAWNAIFDEKTGRFKAPSIEADAFGHQVLATQQVLGSHLGMYFNDEGNVIRGLMGEEDSAKLYTSVMSNSLTETLNQTDSTVLKARRQFIPMMANYTGMEITELAQGPGATNRARMAMGRDVAMLSDRPGILKELLSRSNVDVQLMTYQQQLLNLSLSSETSEQFEDTLNQMVDYVKNAGYDQEEIKSMLFAKTNAGAGSEVIKKDFENFAGGSALGNSMNPLRDERIAMSSWLSPKNVLGKVTIFEDGRFGFLPGSASQGGLIRLEDGMSWEGIAGIIHQNMIMPMINDGEISLKNAGEMALALPGMMKDQMGFSKAVIEEAYYAKNIALDFGAINDNPFLKELQGKYEHDLVHAAKSTLTPVEQSYRGTLSNTTIFSEDIMRDSIRQQITRAVERNPGDVSGVLGESRFWKKYEKELSQLNAINDAERSSKISDVTQKIIDEQKKLAEEIHNMTMGGNGYTQTLNDLSAADKVKRMDQIGSAVRDNGPMSFLLRDPNIYVGSGSGQYALIDHNNTLQEKQIATGYDYANLGKADWDGDAFKALVTYTDYFAKSTRGAVFGGAQESAHRFMLQAKSNYISTMGVNSESKIEKLYGFKNIKSSEAFAKAAIEELPMLTALSASLQHGMTGATDVKQFGMQGHLEGNILNAKNMTTEMTMEANNFARILPSFITEQELISAKQIQKLFEGMDTTSGTEAIFNIIGNIKAGDMKNAMVRSGGTVPVLALFTGARAQETRGMQEGWQETIDFMNNATAVKFNLKVVNEEALKEVFAATEFSMHISEIGQDSDMMTAINNKISSYTDNLKEAWKLHEETGSEYLLPIAEREWAKEIKFNGDFIDLVSHGLKHKSSINPIKIVSDVSIRMKAANSSFDLQENAREFYDEVVSAATSVDPYRQGRAHLGSAEAEGILPNASRIVRGWEEVKEFLKPAGKWISDSPLPRLGGIAAGITAGIAALNLFSGDGTPQRPGELPRYNNPTFEGNNFHQSPNYDMMNSYMRSNNSNSLLSDNTVSLSDSISAINSHVNLSGHNAISVREDRSNPYLSDMHNTFNH